MRSAWCLATLLLVVTSTCAVPLSDYTGAVGRTPLSPDVYAQEEHGIHTSDGAIIPLLSAFGEDPVQDEWNEAAGVVRTKRTFCKKCGFGGFKKRKFGGYGGGFGHGCGGFCGGGFRKPAIVVPVYIAVKKQPVYAHGYYPRNYCNVCGGYGGGGGGGGSYSQSFSYSQSSSYGRRRR